MKVTGKSILNQKEFEEESKHQYHLISFGGITKYFSSRIMNNLLNNIHTEALEVEVHLEKLHNYGHRYYIENKISCESMEVALIEFYKCKGVK